MDIDRRKGEAELGDQRKARLIEENELPEFLLQSQEDLEQIDIDETSDRDRGSRVRKEVVTYQEHGTLLS